MKNTISKIKENKMKLTNIITKLTIAGIMMVGTLSAQASTYDYNSLYNNSKSLYNNSLNNNNLYNNSYSNSNSYTSPYRSENGDIKGYDNDGDGRLEPTYVKGYYKSNGTYVRSHYRAKPRRY